ncbi:antibiotic biosynthesis monooxygenase [Streptomyces sp. 8N114]|uniref:antibiotic biosynthesis monooxygenase n=1 Tax=Streptomyces sp. 8N114 TaxID=3457419 RepID=UPI003FD69D94
MTAGFIAFHYPRPEHFEEFVGRTHQVKEFLQSKAGFLSADIWATTDGDAVITSARFESEEALGAALAAARELGSIAGFDEREYKPREIFTVRAR